MEVTDFPMEFSIVIPAHNEAENLPRLLAGSESNAVG